MKLNLYGFASGIAANKPDCGLAPFYLYYHPELWKALPFEVEWRDLLMATSDAKGLDVLPELQEITLLLAQNIVEVVKQKELFCVIGGDHSSAIGTWSGAAHAVKNEGPLGLIWIDAHLDSHTPETSLTQNIHGMPVSHLLGLGLPALSHLLSSEIVMQPQHLCLIGIRSYEAGELALLKNLNVKVFFMDEVIEKGIDSILREALSYLRSQQVKHFGLSIDLDAFDPEDAPGVGCPEPNGMNAEMCVKALSGLHREPGFLGLELTEYNPILDIDAKTAKLITRLIHAVYMP